MSPPWMIELGSAVWLPRSDNPYTDSRLVPFGTTWYARGPSPCAMAASQRTVGRQQDEQGDQAARLRHKKLPCAGRKWKPVV